MATKPKKPTKKIQVKDLETRKNPRGGESTDDKHKILSPMLSPKL
jgi:hypothetical protein